MPRESSKQSEPKAEKSGSTVSKRPPPKTLSLWPPGAIGYETDTFYPLNDNNPRVHNERQSVFKIMKRIQEKNPEFLYNELQNDDSTIIDEVKYHILDSIEEPERKAQREFKKKHLLGQHFQQLQEHKKSKQKSMLPGFIHNLLNPEPKTPALPQDTPRQWGVPESPRFSKGGKTRRKIRDKGHKHNRRKTQHNNK